MKNLYSILTLVLSTSVVLAVLEVGARFVVDAPWVNKHAQLTEEALNFYESITRQMHHVRRPETLNGQPTDALYSVVSPFLQGKRNFLLQGDSWAEGMEKSASRAEITKFSSRTGSGFITAGISSYSPSPMTAQIRVLRERFDIFPTDVVAIIDQTDIGDELCRYASRRKELSNGYSVSVSPEPFESSEVYAMSYFFEKQRALRSDNLFIWRIAKAAFTRIRHEIVKEDLRCGWSEISAPLSQGLADADAKKFKRTVATYILEVFADPRVQSLTLVTHPHRNHLTDKPEEKYVLNVADLLRAAVRELDHRSRISILDFNEPSLGVYLYDDRESPFKVGDPASHLTEKAHAYSFTRKILEAIDPSAM